MMQNLGKSHEQRIADLERQVAELQRIVGAPHQVGLGQWGQGQDLAQMQAKAYQQANNRANQGMHYGPNGIVKND